jgi:tetratricopeptide (TPR) repeat protein
MDKSLREALHLIEQLMNDGQIVDSIELLRELSQTYPENYHIVSLLGECYLMNGSPEKAIKPLQWATKTFPSFRKDLIKDLKQDPNDNEQEEITVTRIRRTQERTSEKNVWVDHYLLGCAYGRCMKLRPAIRHLNLADKMNPDNAEIIRNIGWIRCMQEKPDNGRKLLKKAIQLDPSNALAYNDLGASYLFEERLDEAQEWIKKAIEMDPEDNFIRNTADKLEELIAYRTLSKKKGRLVSREKA